ncbi:MAG: hypothetical protein AAGA30_09655, partial [Planctomycetota bacterium]
MSVKLTSSTLFIPVTMAIAAIVLTTLAGCQAKRARSVPRNQPCQTFLDQIEYPDVCDESCLDESHLLSGPPITVSNFHEMQPFDLTLDECVVMALSGSKVIQRLGGVVVNSPQVVSTTLDPAILES